MRGLSVALVGLVCLAALGSGSALAQYPPPNGNCTVTPSDPNPGTGATIQLTVTATKGSGETDPGAAGKAVLVSQPGTGASVAPGTFTTGPDGRAVLTVQTGSAPGQLSVNVDCGVDRVAGVRIPVGVPPTPPSTGTGTSSSSSLPLAPVWLLGSVLLLGGIGARLAVRRARR